jgi:hypothetical protein
MYKLNIQELEELRELFPIIQVSFHEPREIHGFNRVHSFKGHQSGNVIELEGGPSVQEAQDPI